jgi:NitT/TauT family transport system permease protein
VIGVGMRHRDGVVTGVIIGWYKRLAMIFEPFLTALYSTPRVALIPLILIWFGIGCGRRCSSCSSTRSSRC